MLADITDGRHGGATEMLRVGVHVAVKGGDELSRDSRLWTFSRALYRDRLKSWYMVW